MFINIKIVDYIPVTAYPIVFYFLFKQPKSRNLMGLYVVEVQCDEGNKEKEKPINSTKVW